VEKLAVPHLAGRAHNDHVSGDGTKEQA
jgi:hypothetical protein